MLNLLLQGLAILHLGPGFAFAVLAFGCEPLDPWAGALCQRSTLASFATLTVAAWVVMVLTLLVWRRLRRPAPSADR